MIPLRAFLPLDDPPPRVSPPLDDSPPRVSLPPDETPPRVSSPDVSVLGVVTAVKEKCRRHKKGTEKAKPGKQSWVYGTKLQFFEHRKEDWLREAEAEKSGPFYTKMVKLYIAKYGYHLRDDQDLGFDVEDPPDSADTVVHEVLDDAEKEFRALYLKNLRTRIGQWYRTTYGSLLRSEKTAFKDLFTGVLDGAPPKPQRGRIEHFYSRKFYKTRVKSRVEARLEALKRRAEVNGKPAPEAIDIVAKVTAEVWEEESPEFRKECEIAMEREHKIAIKGWEESLADSPTRTPEEIASTLANAAYYLQPFVDAIQERFGMCASVLLCGPIGIRGGRIGMQSVHSGKTKGLAPVSWPEFNWQAFSEVERSMVAFGRECFSEAECRARAISGLGTDVASILARSQEAEGASGSGTSGSRAGSGSTGQNAAQSMPRGQSILGAAGTASLLTSPPQVQNPQMGIDGSKGSCVEVGGAGSEGDGGADDWTEELGRAHVAFERGRGWGVGCAICVRKLFDFESACEFTEGATSGNRHRPRQVAGWLARMRKWHLPPALGESLGTQQAEDTWTGEWWAWWRSLQPAERVLVNDELSRPEVADWSKTATMHGDNGLLMVLATLCWWGGRAHRGARNERDTDPATREEWAAAVSDVTWADKDDNNKDENEENEPEEVEPATRKRKKSSSAGGPNKKKARKARADNMAPPRGGKRAREKETEEESSGLRRGKRRQLDTDTPRQTRSKAQAGARPKPKPVYGKKSQKS
ncbi:hypothetical protein B0H19DRAFT_1376963 [Mycena capillaripes]|nr:hypothetical protein B0H19DRAFT_1376963 [Mycena capillaripes]